MRLPPERARRHLARLAPRFAGERDVVRDVADVDGLEGEWTRAKATADDAHVLLYFHGGGYVFGSGAMYRELTARLAIATGARVLAVTCRRAPEHRFPAAVDDAVRAYRWLRATGIAADRIVLVGDSSGGALAVTTLLVVRDAAEALPAGAVLISPWVDLEAKSASVDANALLDWGGRAYLRHFAAMYLGDSDPRSPLASPLHAKLDALPPLLILVGGVEVLRDEVTAFARRAETSGVRVELNVIDDMVHGWVMSPAVFPQARVAIDQVARFVAQ